ncbi:hypothetical protein RHS04_07331 [Rhizoctonia solani]|uniref:Uncharacterized protein n=1 Tax=Rhizoctonia solani TaxID=456999 RepID=A0A8H7H3A6_9AGAM|nr:hypothetical protein RHS04_07331 [Rhizoctonia solani]
MLYLSLLSTLSLLTTVNGHSSIWHPSMYGFNVTKAPDGRDNRPVAPLRDLDFNQWWMHGHMDAPPNKGDVFQLPAGQTVTTEIACTKGATSYWESGEGGDVRDGNNVCPESPMAAFHTNGISGLGGCGLAIAYKNDVHAVKPEDFAIFSHICVLDWNLRRTIQSLKNYLNVLEENVFVLSSGFTEKTQEEKKVLYMNPFDCAVANATSTVPIPPPQVPRYCPVDKTNCTVGAKQPFYWLQNEGNNIFTDSFDPPTYTDDYGFKQGAQNDLWDSLAKTTSTASVPIIKATSENTTGTASGSRVAGASLEAPSDLSFPDIVDPVGSNDPNTTISSLNNTASASSDNSLVHSTSPVQHLLAGSSRKIRGCNAHQVSGPGKQKRSYVIRKRATSNVKNAWYWW